MKRPLFVLFALAAMLVCVPTKSANAAGGVSHGHSNGHSIGHAGRGRGFGFGRGFGGIAFGGGYDDGWDIAELYRQLYNNLPYFALHPPVYYSYPVPRTYGYSPFAYMPDVMTPDIVDEAKPVTINNPYVPSTKPASNETKSDRSASTTSTPEPLVIINPYVTPNQAVAKSGS